MVRLFILVLIFISSFVGIYAGELGRREQKISIHYWLVGNTIEYREGESAQTDTKGEVLRKSDPITFEVCWHNNKAMPYGIDRFQVYYKGDVIRKADPRSFQVLDAHYSKDASAVFYDGKKIKGADAGSFTVTEITSPKQSDAYDATQFYSKGKAVTTRDNSTESLTYSQ